MLTLHPDHLAQFIDDLETNGFERTGPRTWQGPRPDALDDIAASEEMAIVLRNGWPYRPPQIKVEGIDSWHADRDNLCLWQDGDDTRRWTSLAEIHDRIRQWVADYENDFAAYGVGRDPELYFEELPEIYALIDIDEVLGSNPTDGQSDRMNFSECHPDNLPEPLEDVLDIRPGPHTAQDPLPRGMPDRKHVRGRWYYRDTVEFPPRNLDEIRSALTSNQREKFDADLNNQQITIGLYGLFWDGPAGIVGSVVLVFRDGDETATEPVALRPKGRAALIRRAGPDADHLQRHQVLLFGVGAIGSHVASLLTRSGTGSIDLVDGDSLWPANLVRHAAPTWTPPNCPKPAAMGAALDRFDWTDLRSCHLSPWSPSQLGELIRDGADLVIDATGNTAFSEQLSAVCQREDRPLVSVALFRGGTVSRVRRQAHQDDTPFPERSPLYGYPDIPRLSPEREYLATLDTGCAAPVNNAPPTAVARAAALAAEVAIDALTDRWEYDDEVIDVLRPTSAPFDQIGHLRDRDLPAAIQISETAQATMRATSGDAAPNETGGVLIGTRVGGLPTIDRAVELPPADPTPTRYQLAANRINEAVEQARSDDGRLGYLGEFHSHPSDHGPSSTDRRMMQRLLRDPDTGHPILIVVRPVDGRPATLDAYLAEPERLRPASIETVGPLPDSDLNCEKP